MSSGRLTLEQHLAAGYRHAMHGGDDPAPACAAEIPKPELLAEAARLKTLVERDHISRVRLAFMQRVMEIGGALKP
jgi:hypothetical protein